MSEIKLYSHGGVQEVTGSKHVLEVDGKKMLVDCGMFQGKREETYRRNLELPFPAEEIEAVFLTHGHFDHCGNLPTLIKNGFKGRIYATPASMDIAELILRDSAHIQKKDAEFIKKMINRKHRKNMKVYEPIYTHDDVSRTMNHFFTVGYNRSLNVLENVQAEFYDAGHILGSFMVVFTIQDENSGQLRIGFSGDLGRKDLPIIRDPQRIPDPDYFILESTYGNRLHEDIAQANTELAQVINDTVDRGGKIIIPAFSVERTQEMIYSIHVLRKDGRIPALPVFIDSPMAVSATKIFRSYPECFDKESFDRFFSQNKSPFDFEGVHYVVETRDSKKLNTLTQPAIIISSSGMCESGRILHHLKNNIENPATTILIVGFMAKHTLGKRIADREKEVKIFGEPYQLNAKVKIINAFSAHADYEEIKAYLAPFDFRRLKGIFLVHGEPEAQMHLRMVLLKEGLRCVTPVQYGETYRLV